MGTSKYSGGHEYLDSIQTVSSIRLVQSVVMDITQFIISHRNDALLRGDHNSYRAHLSRRLLTVRRRLGRTTPKGKKYSGSTLGSAEDISKNRECVLPLMELERGLIINQTCPFMAAHGRTRMGPCDADEDGSFGDQ